KLKEKINILINIFTRVVTTIFLIVTIYEALFIGMDVTFKLMDIWGIMLIGLLCAICYLPLLSEKNYSKVTMIILQAGYFVVINATTLATGFLLHWFNFKNPLAVLSFELIIIFVYITVMMVFYKIDYNSAKEMNKKLKERQ
ncbi:MAG: DUF3021 family protein, partial [Treponema sp.]|nr:DUF3021 family protein [Treponema sp.]